VAAVIGFVVLNQALGVREVVAIAMVVVASAGATILGHREAPATVPAARSADAIDR
jgi:threonine/homoserine efflux transporter RhtA